MRKFPSLSKLLLVTLAAILAAATILYSGLWMYSQSWQLPVQLGIDSDYIETEHSQLLKNIYKDGPAEKAGLRAGDRILKVNRERFDSPYSLYDIWTRHKPGDSVELTVQRPKNPSPVVIMAVFQAAPSQGGRLSERLGQDIINTFPVAFLVVGLAVLFLRLEDSNAWLLALMFAGDIAVPGFHFQALGPSLRRFAMADRAILNGFLPALFYFFFAVFPARSPLDRRAPWIKWLGLALALSMALPGVKVGDPQAPAVLASLLGQRGANLVRLFYSYGFITLGLTSLVGNALRASTPEARRKIRVIFWGTLVGVVPVTLALGAQDFSGFHMPLWLAAVVVTLLYLFPLSFAYAVIKHRVLEIPVLLRRSARYLLVQRGFTILLSLVSVGATLIFALSFARYLEQFTGAAVPGGITLGTAFGSLLLWAGTRVHKRVGERIDQAFFRSAYDARVILEDLAEKTRTATDRQELAVLLEHHLKQALQPSSLAVYLGTSDGQLSPVSGHVPPELKTISTTDPMIAELERHGRAQRQSGGAFTWEVSAERTGDTPGPFLLAPLRPDCLVPMLGRDSRLVGLLVLGARLSEEPYSSDDKHLLTSVASQAGVALESIRLGEKIAERIEAERRAAQEMEFARQVQARLFPQRVPRLETLEYSGRCIQARQVGGDYYDFLELRPGRLALVLADIAGKGISGALLMANLQANLRSQYAMALDDLPRLLKSVNQLFYENTGESSYATLFFADYDDSSRRLRYVNCGHLPPLLLRAGECSQNRSSPHPDVERLEPTCTVLGLFDDWACSVREAQLTPGDTLLLYTDGVTEAASSAGEEFGESRLVETMRAQRHLPVSSLLETIVATVQDFSDGEQADDITLVVARCRP
jgi:phosphoserine phosphatase RsbU/P